MRKINSYLIFCSILYFSFCTVIVKAEESFINDTFAIYLNKSKQSSSEDDFEKSISYLLKCLEYSSTNSQKAEIYNSIGGNFFNLSDYHTAIAYYDSSFALNESLSNPLFRGYLYNNYGLAFTQLMEFKKAIYNYQEAAKLLDEKSKGILYYNISKCYTYIGNKDSTLFYLKESYKKNLTNYGNNNYHTLLTELELAEATKKISKDLKERTLHTNNNLLIGNYYTLIGEYKNAEKYLFSFPKPLLKLYILLEEWEKAIIVMDSIRSSYLSVDSKLFLQANERLIYKNAIDLKLKSDTLSAFKIALKSHSNVLKEKLDYNLNAYPSSFNYFDFDSLIYLFVVKDKIKFYKIKTDVFFQSKYNQFLSSFNLRNILDSFMLNFRQYAESSYYLYKKLLPEIQDNMLIIPEGRLLYIPFEALLTELPDTTIYPIYKELPYLLNKTDIRYDYILREYGKPIGRKRVIGLAPNISLKYSVKEVRSLLKYNSKRLTGHRACLDWVFRGDILHIATHYDPRDYAIKFADKDLSMDSINNIKKDLVVLSTCYSGFGKRYEGEGSFSAGRAFYIGGSESIIESIWLNDDRSSFSIFLYFYANLSNGYNKGFSLNKAKRQHLRNCPPSLSHPYFWSNIRFFGNDYPVQINRVLNFRVMIILISLISVVLIYYFFRFKRK
jgi:hypothetical protein